MFNTYRITPVNPQNCLIIHHTNKWAVAWDFQQFDILTIVDSDKPLHPPFKLRNSKWFSVSSLRLIKYSSDKQRLWSDCAYAQADLRLCWSHKPHCWKSHALAQMVMYVKSSDWDSVALNVKIFRVYTVKLFLQTPRYVECKLVF